MYEMNMDTPQRILLLLLVLAASHCTPSSSDVVEDRDEWDQIHKRYELDDLARFGGFNESVRLCIKPTFSNPYTITVVFRQDSVLLTAKKMHGKGGYEWGGLLASMSKKIPQEKCVSLLSKIRNDTLLKPLSEFELALQEMILDGEVWYLEIFDGRAVHYMKIVQPQSLSEHMQTGKVRDPKLFMEVKNELIRLAQIAFTETE